MMNTRTFALVGLLTLAASAPGFAQTDGSRIGWNFRTRQVFSATTVDGFEVNRQTYPRVKHLRNGDLLMLFQEGQVSQNIFMRRSTDGGKTWKPAQYLKKVQDIPGNRICYATGELIQLRNGDLLCAYAYRYNKDRNNENSGLEVMTSRDNGHTWSKPVVAYKGVCWEPSFLQLPSGEVQLYFTQVGPLWGSGRSGAEVGLVRSVDNGKTWAPQVTGAPWRALRLSQNNNVRDPKKMAGVDGMAVATILPHGKGIAYAIENDGGPEGPWIVWSSLEKNWNYPEFTADQFGPWDRRWLVDPTKTFHGAAPYLITLPTGETLLASNGRYQGKAPGFWTFIGDDEAKKFSRATKPFPDLGGFWGSLELKDADTVIASVNYEVGPHPKGWDKLKNIAYTEGIINRPLTASVANIRVDGKLESAWKKSNTVFIGELSRTSVRVQTAADSANLYLAVQAQDERLWKDDGIVVYLDRTGKNATTLNEGILRVTLRLDGTSTLERYDAQSTWQPISSAGIQIAAKLDGKRDDDKDDKGYTLEASVPWSALGGTPTTPIWGIHLKLLDDRTGNGIDLSENMTGNDEENPSTWLVLHLDNLLNAPADSSVASRPRSRSRGR